MSARGRGPWSIYRSNASLSLRRAIGGVEYLRCLEWPWALSNAHLRSGLSVLDVGSGENVFPLIMLDDARMKQSLVTATDITERLFMLARFMPRLEARWQGTGRKLNLEIQDATRLGYADDSFDRVTSISALEHIPDHGDSAAVREIARVLRPGGYAVITVPAAIRSRDIWRNDDELMRKYGAPRTYWAHIYSEQDIQDRLVQPSGLDLEKLELFGDTWLPFERWYRKLGRGGIAVRPLLPLAARLCLRPTSWRNFSQDATNPATCCLVLRKPTTA